MHQQIIFTVVVEEHVLVILIFIHHLVNPVLSVEHVVEAIVLAWMLWLNKVLIIVLSERLAVLLQEQPQLFIDLVLGLPFEAFAPGCTLASLRLFLESLSVSQRVERVIGGAHARANAGQHDDFDLIVGQKRVSQDHGKLALPEGHMLSLSLVGLSALLIQSSHALLEAKERLVDLCSLGLSVFVVTLAVLGTLTTCEVYEQELTALLDCLLLYFDLGDRVTSTRSIVGLGRMRGPHLVSLLNKIENLIIIVYELFFQASNLDCVCFVFAQFEFSVIIEQVVELASIDLVHRDRHCEVPLVILPVVDALLEQILDCDALNAVHGVRFARSCLPIGEYGDDALVEDQVEYGSHLEEVELLTRLDFAEGIIELELRVFNCLGDAIDLVLAVMNNDFRISYCDYVDLAVCQFLVENGPLLEADADFHLIRKSVHFL